MTSEQVRILEARLNVIIFLLMNSNSTEKKSLREQVSTLDNLGIRPIEIAQILGKTTTYVSKELVSIRRAKKNNKEKK